MSKKIQISAVEMKALSEVIVLNTSFVAKAVRAADVAQKLANHLNDWCPVSKIEEAETFDFREWEERGYNITQLRDNTIREVFEKLVPFVLELSNALLGEEA